MQRGGQFLTAAAAIAMVGCSANPGKLEIRPAGTSLSAAAKPVPERIAEARGHLALGNAGLALETFRKAAREQPDSIEALTGMAASYDAITRYDLSRRYYEAALALAPADTTILAAFASSLELQGKAVEATAVRKEIRMRQAAALPAAKPAPAVQLAQASQSPLATPAPRAKRLVPIAEAPKVAKAPEAPTVGQAKPTPQPAIAVAQRPLVAPPKALAPTVSKQAAKPAPIRQQLAERIAAPAVGPTITIALPPARPAPADPGPVRPEPADRLQAQIASIPTPARPEPIAVPKPAKAHPVLPPKVAKTEPIPAPNAAQAPRQQQVLKATRLERLSLGEVALVTSAKPQWRPQVVERRDRSTTIRFVPLQSAQARMAQARPPIRLLNAARYRGLAARTRNLLEQRGWRRLAIGDAIRVREKSLILYPASRRATAERLAAQFGFPLAKRPSGSELVVLLGRDAYRRPRRLKG